MDASRESGSEERSGARGGWILWAVAGAVVVGAVLRFGALGEKALWCDELATLQRLELSFPEHVRAMQGNHPLYELVLRSWTGLEGSDAWVRIPSAAVGVLAVWLTWILLRSTGPWAALAATWLMAVSPLHVMYSRIARSYSPACTLALASNLALLWAVKRRTWFRLTAYAVTTALMVYANLLAASIWVAQGLFLLWFYRRRLGRLWRWIAAHAGVGLLILPWMIFSVAGAVRWGQETTYTAQQLGKLYKVAHVAMALCVGETVHPLNMIVVPIALVGFGAAMVLGIRHVLKRRNGMGVFLLVQVVVGFGVGLYFAAASPKHLTMLLPAWFGVIAVGIAGRRLGYAGAVCLVLIGVAMGVSDRNYFANREFTDADMVTPWREMARETKGELVVVGYQMDRGAYDMFRRYHRGAEPRYLFAGDWHELADMIDAKGKPVRFRLLLHDGDPWAEIEAWMKARGWTFEMRPYQEEEHTLKGLQEWRAARAGYGSFRDWVSAMPGYARKYRSPLYRLYSVSRREEA